MDKIYIDKNNPAEITLREDMRLDIKLASGKVFESTEAIRLFPISNSDCYLSVLDNNGNEVAIIRNASHLSVESQEALAKFLHQYYIIPDIKKVNSISWKDGTLTVNADTDYGVSNFKVRSRLFNIKYQRDGRVIIRDVDDNRYQITNPKALDSKTKELMLL